MESVEDMEEGVRGVDSSEGKVASNNFMDRGRV